VKRLIEFPLQAGGSVIVEVDEPALEGVVRAARRPGEVAEKAKATFEDAFDKIKPAADHIVAKLRGLHDTPDEIGVEFGIKLSAEAGAFVASASAEANYKVTLKWTRK